VSFSESSITNTVEQHGKRYKIMRTIIREGIMITKHLNTNNEKSQEENISRNFKKMLEIALHFQFY
jgi:hypothetical protein